MDATYFKPEDPLTFKSVVSIRAKLYKALMEDETGRFCLDLSAVTHCDSAGLALLIEAKKLCKQSKKTFEMVGVSSKTQSLAEFCGVKNILETI